MTNAFVDSGIVQITPNYPPYALKLVRDRKGYVVSTGEIGHAFVYSPYVNGIDAVEINADLVRFYSEMQEAIKGKDFAEFQQYMERLSEQFPGGRLNGHSVSAGPSFYLPFMLSEEEYRAVRDSIGKVSVHEGDCIRFFEETPSWYSTALLNNVPAYVENWTRLFCSLPLELGGVMAFSTNANNVVYTKGSNIHPGVLKGAFGFVSPGKDWQKVDVETAMRTLGYSPIEVPIVRNVTAKDRNLVTETVKSKKGKAEIFVKSSYPYRGLQVWHNLYAFQRIA